MCSLRLENDFHRRYVVRNNDRGILRPALSPPPLSFLFSTPIYVSPGSTLACPRCVSPGTRLHPLSLCTLQLKTSLLIDPVATAARLPLPPHLLRIIPPGWKIPVTRRDIAKTLFPSMMLSLRATLIPSRLDCKYGVIERSPSPLLDWKESVWKGDWTADWMCRVDVCNACSRKKE